MNLLPAKQNDEWTFRQVVWATIVLVFLVFCFWLIFRFYEVIFIVFVAIIMGTVLRPVVAWMHKRGLPRFAGALLLYILFFGLLIGFLFLVFPLIFSQGKDIIVAIPGYYQTLRDWMIQSPNELVGRLSQSLPQTLPIPIPGKQTGEEMLVSFGQAFRITSSATSTIFFGTAFLVLVLQWTLEGPRTIRSFLLLATKNQRDSILELISAMETKVGFYIAGQGVLCLVIAIMSLVAYLLIGLPNALILALIAGVLEAVPMIGPLLGAIPALVIALTISPAKFGWVIASTVIIQQLENSLLVPRIMRKAVGVNPFVTLVAFFAFSSLFGITGSLMAIPMAAIIQLLLNRYVFNPPAIEAEISTKRDAASRLSYEAQDLVQGLRKQARLKKDGSVRDIKKIDQIMDEIESITTDLDALLIQTHKMDSL